VSNGLPLGVIFASEKMPSHLNPARILFFSSSLSKVALVEMVDIRSVSLDPDAPMIFWLLVVEKANVNQLLHKFWETSVSQCSADDGLSLWNIISFSIRCRVAVGIGNKGEARVDVIWLGSRHQVWTSNIYYLATLPKLGSITECEQNSARAPAELVTQWVARVLGRGQASAVGEKGLDLSTLFMDFFNGLDGIKMIDTWIQANLVHDCDSCILGLLVEFQHGGRDIAGRYHILLVSYRRLDDTNVECVWNQANNQIMFGYGSIESLVVGGIQGNGSCELDAL
jgi:hypothetical protein